MKNYLNFQSVNFQITVCCKRMLKTIFRTLKALELKDILGSNNVNFSRSRLTLSVCGIQIKNSQVVFHLNNNLIFSFKSPIEENICGVGKKNWKITPTKGLSEEIS